MERTNQDRAESAREALDAYARDTRYGTETAFDPEELAGDLIADILHYGAEHLTDPLRLLELGRMHYEAERDEEMSA